MVEEMLGIAERLLLVQPNDLEARLRKGEALLHLEQHDEALEAFTTILKTHPMHALAHLGAAQARSFAGGDPFPHLDAALELNREAALSVLRETYDFRVLPTIPGETVYPRGRASRPARRDGRRGEPLPREPRPALPGRHDQGVRAVPVGLDPEPLPASAHQPPLARTYTPPHP